MTEPMMIRVRVPAPIKDVRHALTDATALREWFAEHAEVELPHRYEFWGKYTPQGDAPHQRLTHVDDRRLRFEWRVDDVDTTVEIGLEDEDGGSTILNLTQTDLPGFEEMVAETTTLSQLHTFWAVAVANLVDYVEGRPLTPKCDFTSAIMREEVLIDASPHEVYRSLVDPATFAKWFGAKMEIEEYVGGRWAMGSLEHEPHPAKIIELEPDRTMTMAWEDGLISSWELAESAGKTRLTFVQSGFDEQRPPYGGWMGWLSGVAELRRFHELREWRTIWLDVHVEGMPDGLLTIGQDA